MTRQEKNQQIDILADKISSTNVLYLTDISNLDAETTSKLRRECFKKNISINVVKNTLLRKAFEKVNEEIYNPLFETLKGNTSIMISEASNAPAKLIQEFRKKSDRPVLKSAFIEQEAYIGDDQLNLLADLKSKDELIGDLIMLLQSPAKNVVSALGSGGSKLSGILKALADR